MFANDAERTASLLDAWIVEHPDEPAGYAARGTALCRMRRGAQAKPDLERALALGSTDAGVHGMLGMVLEGEGAHQPAVEHLRAAIAGDWYSSELYGYLGHALLLLGENAEGVRAYERALELGMPPGAATAGVANYNLACGYARLGRIEDALAALERAVEQRFGTRREYESDPDLDPLHDHARFRAALERLGS
jgi:tetratricopeptide (TPR) repeat protein